MFKFYSTSKSKLKDIIGKSPKLKFNSVKKFNDPYEFKFNIKLDPEDSLHKELFFRERISATESEFGNWKNQVTTYPNFPWYQEQLIRSNLTKAIKICSLTEINSNILMWSHYTNNHSGFCVEYSANLIKYLSELDEFISCGKVKYSESPPTFSDFQNKESILKDIFFNKYIDWQYEREYRFILENKGLDQLVQISPEIIKAVYLGSRMKPTIEAEIIKLCKKNDIDIYYAITLGDNYEILFEKKKQNTHFCRSF